MKTDGRFATAVHVLAVLAFKDGDPVSSEFLSASVNTHPVIIRRLLLDLQAARLVETRKGPRAGSRLACSASRISMGDIYRAVCPGPLFGLPRNKPNRRCPVGHCIRSILEATFGSAEAALERDLRRTSLAAVLARVRAAAPNPPES